MLFISYGTRPEWIKVKPVIDELRKRNIEHKVLFTGQHKDIANFFFDIRIDLTNNCLDNRLDSIFSEILEKVNKLNILDTATHLLVQGDTASVAALSLVAFHRKIKVMHLEAGLRTYNKLHPYPEEVYRQFVSRVADYHFCPTESNKQNLIEEKTQGEKFVIGNTVLDNLKDIETSYEDKVLVTLHRRENHEHMRHWFKKIEELAAKYRNLDFYLPIHPNPNVLKHKEVFKNVNVIEPMEHRDLLKFLAKCKIVITDSGGIQEESSFLKKKCIVCRKFTERQEGIGEHAVICDSPDSLLKLFELEVKNYKLNENYVCPYGDGLSSIKLVNIYEKINSLCVE